MLLSIGQKVKAWQKKIQYLVKSSHCSWQRWGVMLLLRTQVLERRILWECLTGLWLADSLLKGPCHYT